MGRIRFPKINKIDEINKIASEKMVLLMKFGEDIWEHWASQNCRVDKNDKITKLQRVKDIEVNIGEYQKAQIWQNCQGLVEEGWGVVIPNTLTEEFIKLTHWRNIHVIL